MLPFPLVWLIPLLLQATLQPERDDYPASVYQVSLPVDGTLTVVAGLGIALPYAFSNQLLRPSCPCDPRSVNAFDRAALGQHSAVADVLSDVTVGLAWLLPMLGDSIDTRVSRAFYEDILVYAETLAVNGALVTGAKYLVARPLPLAYGGVPGLVSSPNGYRSFYSGHTSNAAAATMFAAMTLRLRHGEHVWPWLLATAVTLSVGTERVVAGRHFPTDVLVGGAVGTLVGVLVPWLHRRRTPFIPSLSPTPRADGAQLTWVGTL